VRRRVAHGQAPNWHGVVAFALERQHVAWSDATRVKRAVGSIIWTADDAGVELDVILGVPCPPHDYLGHPRLRSHHETRNGLGRLDCIFTRNVKQEWIEVDAHAFGGLATQRVERRCARGRLGLRDHRLEYGGVLGSERGLPILQKVRGARVRHRSRGWRTFALERQCPFFSALHRLVLCLGTLRIGHNDHAVLGLWYSTRVLQGVSKKLARIREAGGIVGIHGRLRVWIQL